MAELRVPDLAHFRITAPVLRPHLERALPEVVRLGKTFDGAQKTPVSLRAFALAMQNHILDVRNVTDLKSLTDLFDDTEHLDRPMEFVDFHDTAVFRNNLNQIFNTDAITDFRIPRIGVLSGLRPQLEGNGFTWVSDQEWEVKGLGRPLAAWQYQESGIYSIYITGRSGQAETEHADMRLPTKIIKSKIDEFGGLQIRLGKGFDDPLRRLMNSDREDPFV